VPSYPVVAGRVWVAQAADPPTARVTATAFASGGFAAMASKHHRRPARIDIGFVRVRVPKHHVVQIKIRLTRHGMKLIKRRHHLLVEVVIHATRTAGRSIVLKHDVVITG
jgi:hypothetical protein